MTFHCAVPTCSADVDLPGASTRGEVDQALANLGWAIENVGMVPLLVCPRCKREGLLHA